MLEFAREIIAATGSRSKIVFVRCRRTIRGSVGRTLRGRGSCWVGSRGWRWRRGLSRLLSIFGARSSACGRRRNYTRQISRIMRENDA